MFFVRTRPIEQLQYIKGIAFPAHVSFRQLLITGPPGAGKSTLIRKLGGWSEEGYVDLALNNWWAAQSLSLRPREIHLGVPYEGFAHSLAVFDREWLEAAEPLAIAYSRIRIPASKRFFFSVDWRGRYVFEFLVPPPGILFRQRLERARRGSHPVDAHLEMAQVRRQAELFLEIASYLQHRGISVYLREGTEGIPLHIVSRDPNDPGSSVKTEG